MRAIKVPQTFARELAAIAVQAVEPWRDRAAEIEAAYSRALGRADQQVQSHD